MNAEVTFYNHWKQKAFGFSIEWHHMDKVFVLTLICLAVKVEFFP